MAITSVVPLAYVLR